MSWARKRTRLSVPRALDPSAGSSVVLAMPAVVDLVLGMGVAGVPLVLVQPGCCSQPERVVR